MSCVLRYFYHEIIKDRYGYQILSSEQKNSRYLEENEIEYIYLGDTRHIAMINILAEGGNIVTAMLLADHNNIMMSSHYATNISSLIECKTYRQYKKYLGQNATYELSHFNSIPEFNDDYILFDNGDRCFSPRFLHGSIDDCVLVSGENGEIGECRNCKYYRRATPGNTIEKGPELKRKIQTDCDFLKEVISKYRKGYSEKEDILQAVMRLQTSSYSYQQFCQEQLIHKNNTKEEHK